MPATSLIVKIRPLLADHGEIAFAYLHGSSLHAANPNDIDIAIYLFLEQYNKLLAGSPRFDFAMPLEQELEIALGKPCDIQLLNAAPLPFRARVVTQGTIILDRSPDVRERFELLARVEYFDFRPRRERYLREALTHDVASRS